MARGSSRPESPPPIRLVVQVPREGPEGAAWTLVRRRAEWALRGLQIREAPCEPPCRFALSLERPYGGAIVWDMLPDQNAEAPFLGLLEGLAQGSCPVRAETQSALASLADLPPMTVFGARWCGASAGALALACSLAVAEPRLSLHVVDAEAVPKEALPPAVTSVPWTIFGSDVARLFGTLKEEETLAAIRAAVAGTGGRHTLAHLLGLKMKEEAGLLLAAGIISPEDAGWLASRASDLGVRLAATLFLSEWARRDRALAGRSVPALVEGLASKEARIRGDAAFALGEVGDPSASPALERALQDGDEEVREAACEALQKIKDLSAPGAERPSTG